MSAGGLIEESTRDIYYVFVSRDQDVISNTNASEVTSQEAELQNINKYNAGRLRYNSDGISMKKPCSKSDTEDSSKVKPRDEEIIEMASKKFHEWRKKNCIGEGVELYHFLKCPLHEDPLC